MRLVFAGTPEPAVASFHALHDAGHEIAAVITRPDAPLGRKRVMTPSPVAAAAAELGIPTLKAARLDDAVTARIGDLAPDLGVIVAYGGLVRAPLLAVPRLGWINLHFSLLPRWRGAAPVQHALIAGDRVTGASVFRLVPELDAGDVFAETSYPVPDAATAGEVLDDLARVGSRLLAQVVADLAAGHAHAEPQQGEPSYAAKLTLDDGRIRWSDAASVVLDRVRGTTPEPGAHTTIAGGRLKVLAAARHEPAIALPVGEIHSVDRAVLAGTGDDAVRLIRVQPAGKPAMDAGDWWRGLRTDSIRVDDPLLDAPQEAHA